MVLSCGELLRLVTEYNQAIVRCDGRPNGIPLKEQESKPAFTALKAALSAYQDHVNRHHCASGGQERTIG